MLSDHAFSLFGWHFTITGQMQLLAIVAVVVFATTWVVNFFRRHRSVALYRSAVSDQMLYELSRIADSLDRLANIHADNLFSSASNRVPESREIPYSMFGRERPQS